MPEIHIIKDGLFVPHRIVRVGQATVGGHVGGRIAPPVAADTVADVVGKKALARANEAIRDVPKREQIIKVNMAGESSGVIHPNKQPSMMPAATGDMYPGEHRYAYQLEAGDKILQLGDPSSLIGRWVHILNIQVAYIEQGGRNVAVNAHIEGQTETGNRVVLDMQGNAQVRLVTNTEEPTK